MVELDFEIDLEAVERLELRPLVAVFDAHALLDAHEFLGHALIFETRRLQQEHERAGAAIHDGHFGRADVDVRIVDTKPGECRQQVLHGRNARRTINKSGAELGITHVLGVGTNFGRRIEISAAEDDAGIRRGRPQGHEDLLAGVQANTLGADGVLESALSEHLKLSPAAVTDGARVAPPGPNGPKGHRGAAARTLRHRAPKRGATVTQLPYAVCGVSRPGASERPEYPAHLRVLHGPEVHRRRPADAEL